jgi:hypothetical protein
MQGCFAHLFRFKPTQTPEDFSSGPHFIESFIFLQSQIKRELREFGIQSFRQSDIL